ncbi:putative reverse transcriptase domain-containing protein, partial [Tanacetum coccineum]
QKVKYFAGSLTGRALTWWNSEVRTRGREAESFGITPWLELIIQHTLTDSMSLLVAETKPPTIQSAILKVGVLTDKANKNGSLNRNSGESSKERNVKGDNMRARTGKMFTTITNPVRKEAGPRMVNLLNAKNLTITRGACYECGGTDHYKSACPRLNRAPGQGGNCPNQAMAFEGGQGHGNNEKPTHGRSFMMGAEEVHQDPNIMTGTFSLNNHYATMLFDSGADYRFVSTTFVPLLDIEPNSLVQIPLPHGEIPRVYGERPEEKVKRIMGAKVEELKLKDIAIVQNFSKVFPDYLSTLPPSREVEFRIDLIPRAMPVAKSPYRLTPTEMKELSNQLKELQDKGFIRPSSSLRGAPILFVKKKDGNFKMCIDYRKRDPL